MKDLDWAMVIASVGGWACATIVILVGAGIL
jgi:hypothetical protein